MQQETFSKEYLNKLATDCYKTAVDRGQYKNRAPGLDFIAEVMELYKAGYKNDHCELTKEELIHLGKSTDNDSFMIIYRNKIEDTVESEWADVVITALSYMRFLSKELEEDITLCPCKVHGVYRNIYELVKLGLDFNLSPLRSTASIINMAYANCPNLFQHIALKMRYNANRKD